MDGGAWWAAVHGVTKSRTRLSGFTFTFHFHALEKEMATHYSVLAWRIPGMGSPVGYHLWGHTQLKRLSSSSSIQYRNNLRNFLKCCSPIGSRGFLIYQASSFLSVTGHTLTSPCIPKNSECTVIPLSVFLIMNNLFLLCYENQTQPGEVWFYPGVQKSLFFIKLFPCR